METEKLKKLEGIDGALKQHKAFKMLGVSQESLGKLTVMDAVTIMHDLNDLLEKHKLILF